MFTLQSKSYDGRYLEVTCLQVPDVAGNCSRIDWTLSVVGGNSSWYSTGPTTLCIGGQQVYYSKRRSYTTKAFPAARGSVSGSLTLPHNDDGTLTVSVSLTTAIYTSTLTETVGQWSLAPIARASLIRSADAAIGSCATVVITRRSEAFSHSVAWQLGSLSGWLNAAGEVVEEEVRFTESTLNFLLPERFYDMLTDSPSGECLLNCSTFHGQEPVGQESCSFRVSADPAVCSPLVTGGVSAVDELTLTLTDGRLIPGISTACCCVTAVPQKGARLVSVTAGGVPVTEGQALLPGWALEQVPVVALDSRGFETRLLLPCACVPYRQLTVLGEARRPAPTADSAVLTFSGDCFAGSFGAADNHLEARVEVNGETLSFPIAPGENGYEAQVELTGLSYTGSYPVTVTVTDAVMSATCYVTVRKGIPVFDWGENDFCFHVPVEVPSLTIGGIPLAEYIRSLQQNSEN